MLHMSTLGRSGRLLALVAAGWAALATPGGAVAPGQAVRAGVPGRADYTITARVSPAEDGSMTLTGELEVRWTNRTDRATDEAWFHLYHNAYSSTRSTHLVEAKGELRGHALEEGFGWQRVTAISARGQDLLDSFAYRAPDDGNPFDRTVFSVDLPGAVEPGATEVISVSWEARIPRVRRRTGSKGDFLFMAHWFPKLGVFEGERGWNCHQFHANTEFYSNFGTYDVTLDLPGEYRDKVGASGKLMVDDLRDVGDRIELRYIAPSPQDQERLDATGKRPLVHGFAWTADPDFVKKEATFRYDAWRSEYAEEVEAAQLAFGPDRNLRLRNVQITLLIQPEHEDQWQRHVDATQAALFFYGLWFGEYPYEHITVVDPAWGARAAGGMEYPTLFTCGTRIGTRADMHSPESVTVHEAGHQFWYGLVGNNEFEAAWLDEGFNSYTDSEVLVRRYGEQQAYTWYAGIPWRGVEPAPGPGGTVLASALAVQAIPLPWVGFDLTPLRSSGFLDAWRDQPQLTFVPSPTDPRWNDRVRYLREPDLDPIDTHAWKYADRTSYGVNSYSRPAVALRSLPAVVGRERFLRGMRHYSEAWRYRHPYPDDFFTAFNEGAEVDVSWYFDALFRSTATVDWSVEVEQRRVDPMRGFHQPDPRGPFLELTEDSTAQVSDEGVPPAFAAHVDRAQAGAPDDEAELPWHAQVLIVRHGELRLPLEYELRFDDGTMERHVWSREDQAEGRWLELERFGDRKLTAVLLDPDRSWYIDADMSNNSWFDEVDRIAPVRWSERVFNRYIHLLHWQAGLGG